MKSIKAEAKSSRATKLHAMGGKGSPGKSLDLSPGHTFDGQAGLNSGQVYDTQRIPTRKSGGRVEGERAKARMDRTPRASGGRVGKGKTNITVVVAPQGGAQQPQMPPQKIPVPVPVPPAPPMGGPPGGMPGGAPMGGAMPPQMMRKSGGRVKSRADGGSIDPDWRHLKADRSGNLRDADKISPDWRRLKADPGGKMREDDGDEMKRGGRAKRASGGKVHMTAGALSGEGRLQKIALQKAAGK